MCGNAVGGAKGRGFNSRRLTVEEHEGAYGWTEPQDDGRDESDGDPFAISESVKAEAAKLDKSKQVAFWVGRLAKMAADTKRDPEDFDYDVDGNVEQLAAIGIESLILLEEDREVLRAVHHLLSHHPCEKMRRLTARHIGGEFAPR